MSKCSFSIFHNKKNRVFENKPSVIDDYDDNLFLRIRRLYPGMGATIVKANSRLSGPGGQCETKRWPLSDAVNKCGPYVHANSLGWWVFPGIDFDAEYLGKNKWNIKVYKQYENEVEEKFYRTLPGYEFENENGETQIFNPGARDHLAAGTPRAAEPNMLQMWTGAIFRTPPGWCLHVTNPINVGQDHKRPFKVQEGVIESDWMDYDLWTNILVEKQNEKIEFRRNMWPPLAQIVPIRRESYMDKWDVDDRLMQAEDPEWASWQDYNFKKWRQQGKKEPKTYYKERAIQKPISALKAVGGKLKKLRDRFRRDKDDINKTMT
jgi:hypothetical protein